MSAKKQVYFAGASGEIGKRLLQNLIAHNEVDEIHLLVRTQLKLSEPRIHQHLVDFNDLSKLSIQTPPNKDIVSFCTLGTTIKQAGSKAKFSQVDLTFVENFAKWANENNSKQLAVISSVDANTNSNTFYLKTKGMMENSLSSLPWKTLWIARPSLLIGKRKEFRLGEQLGALAAKLINPLLIGPYKKYRPIQMQAVANALTEVIRTDQNGIRIIESDQIEEIATRYKQPEN